ncbi:hypothetical protein N7451_005277 [Penicillium sp. IBT 35674x]|nr:hypothetical protein N7451_005277 [Penicillium sp. IBT 35674x]
MAQLSHEAHQRLDDRVNVQARDAYTGTHQMEFNSMMLGQFLYSLCSYGVTFAHILLNAEPAMGLTLHQRISSRYDAHAKGPT